MKRLIALLDAGVPACLLCLGLVVGCSSKPVETGLSSRAAEMPVAAAAQPAIPPSAKGHRPVRPIPEVIARAKPFRMPREIELAQASMPQSMPQSVTQSMPQSMTQPMSRQPSGPDVAGISGMMRSYLQAFNRHDPAALAAHWSTAGESVDLDSGETTAGREAVREVFTALFEQDAGATIDIDITSIRSLRDDVAVVDGASRIMFTDAPPSSSRFSAVLVRQNGDWVLDTVRESNSPVQQASAESPLKIPARPLDALAWLAGSWEDVGEGVTASTQCYWSPNKSFLIRSHIVTSDAMPEQRPLPGDSRIPGLLAAGSTGSREITEIIGWDEDRGEIRSWLFTSEGRFAEGSWSQEGNAWTVRMHGGPASAGDCIATLTRMGPDEISFRCSTDQFVDILPPACDFVRTAGAYEVAPSPKMP